MYNMSEDTQLSLYKEDTNTDQTEANTPVDCLGITFNNDDERRVYFREELRKKLPELKRIEGFPIGEDDDIINLSDPPYYTACPNPWLNDFIDEWEKEKEELERQGKRSNDFKVDAPFASDISEGKNNPIYNAHSYHTKVPHPAIMRYILHYTQPGDIVFDGFAGTGMTGVAASMCGNPDKETKQKIESEFKETGLKQPNWGQRRAICGDLSPVATFLSHNFNTYQDIIDFKTKGEAILTELEKRIKGIYSVKFRGVLCSINYILYSDIYLCPNCGNEIHYLGDLFDLDDENKSKNSICPKCKITLIANNIERQFETVYDFSLKETIKKKKSIPSIINLKYNNKNIDVKVNELDEDYFSKLSTIQIGKYFPNYRFIEGNEGRRNDRTGLTHTHQLYSKENLKVISELYDLVKNDNIFLFAFLNTSWHATIMRRYNSAGGHRPKSGTLYVPSISSVGNIVNIYKNKLSQLLTFLEVIKGFKLGNSIFETTSANQTLISSNSIDYIFTDPPFGSNIMYSELNFLWECWLKVLTNIENEAIENKSKGKTLSDYQHLMSVIFNEYYRILKPNHWMSVEFSNTSAVVWNIIQNALQLSGFIISNVISLDKKQGSISAYKTSTAVKQDLVISCYKPSSEFDTKFQQSQHNEVGIWDFVAEHLQHLPIHVVKENATTAVVERSPKILFDRLIAFYVQRNLPVPIGAALFQKGLRERFVERDGMFFTSEQALQYEEKRRHTTGVVQMSVFVSSEAEGIEWLKRKLDTPQTYQDLQPQWMQDLAAPRKGDNIPELKVILEDNFLHDDDGRWYKPDLEKETDLEKVRTRKLLREFNYYVELAAKPKVKIKEARLEALRCGFRECYRNNDFQTIVSVGNRLPEALIMEDEILLQFYDIASARV